MAQQQLGKYKLLEELGRGGYGTVFRARETVLDVERAVKVLHPALVADPEFIERFRREAKFAARIEHPHIVPVYELDEVEGSYFLVMKYMSGGSLKELITIQGCLPFERALEITGQIAEALDFAHNLPEKLIHRDVKPGNILFEADGKARLSDFGFAKALSSTRSASLSASDGMIGTPPFMAPEVWRGQEITPATDVYSLVCVFYEMITGEVLFAGESPPEIMTKHVLDGPQFPERWAEDVPSNLHSVLLEALNREERKRFNNPVKFFNALGDLAILAEKRARGEAKEAARRLTKEKAPLERAEQERTQKQAEELASWEVEEKAKSDADLMTRIRAEERVHKEPEKLEIKKVRPHIHRSGKISRSLNWVSLLLITLVWSLAWLVNEIMWDKVINTFGTNGATIIWAIGGALAGVVIGIYLRKYPPNLTSLKTVLWIVLGWAIGPAIGIQITWNTTEPVAFWGGGLITCGIITGLVLRKDNPVLKRKSTIKIIFGWIFGWTIGYALNTLVGDISFRRAIAGATIAIIGSGVMFLQLKHIQEQQVE